MARRKRTTSVLDSEFARPVGALLLLILLWLAFKVGLVAALVSIPFGILAGK